MTAILHALSAALLHFLWQGLAVATLMWLTLFLLRKRPAQLRYAASCGALALLVLLPLTTAFVVYEAPQALSELQGVIWIAAVTATGATTAAKTDWLVLVQTWAVPVWSLGVLLFSVRMLWGCRQVAAMRRAGETADAVLSASFLDLAGRMGVIRPVRILLSPVTDSPSVTGWIRPVVLLPLSAVSGLTPDQLEAVLAHELAHIRRHDYLVNLLQMAAETLLFYHPAVWWISSRIRHERELCCDDLAVRTCGGPLSYARALTALEKMRSIRPTLALAGTDGPLFHRIRRLVTGGIEYGPSRLSGTIVLTLGAASLALFVNWAHGQEPSPAPVTVRIAEQQSRGVTVNTAGSVVLHRPEIEYPGELRNKGVRGTVSVEAILDETGEVIDARVLSGPNELRKTALSSVLDWHFAPGSGNTRIVKMDFEPSLEEPKKDVFVFSPSLSSNEVLRSDDALSVDLKLADLDLEKLRSAIEETRARLAAAHGRVDQEQAQRLNQLHAQLAEAEARLAQTHVGIEEARSHRGKLLLEAELVGKQAESEPLDQPQPLRLIRIMGLSEEARSVLLARLPVRVGTTVDKESFRKVEEIVKQFDQHLEVNLGHEREGGIGLLIHPAGSGDRVTVRFRR